MVFEKGEKRKRKRRIINFTASVHFLLLIFGIWITETITVATYRHDKEAPSQSQPCDKSSCEYDHLKANRFFKQIRGKDDEVAKSVGNAVDSQAGLPSPSVCHIASYRTSKYRPYQRSCLERFKDEKSTSMSYNLPLPPSTGARKLARKLFIVRNACNLLGVEVCPFSEVNFVINILSVLYGVERLSISQMLGIHYLRGKISYGFGACLFLMEKRTNRESLD